VAALGLVAVVFGLVAFDGGTSAGPVPVAAVKSDPAPKGPKQQITFCAQSPGLVGGHAVVTNGGKVKKVPLRSGGQCDNLPNVWFSRSLAISWRDAKGKVVKKTTCELLFPKDKGTWHRCNEIPVHDQLVAYIHDDLVANLRGADFRRLRALCRGVTATAKAGCLSQLYVLVQDKGKWDHKPKIEDKWARDGVLSSGIHFFPVSGTRYLLSYEIWSNIHYAVIGRKAGIDEPTLRIGHQVDVPGVGATDDGDLLAVDLGLELFREHPGELTREHIDRKIRDNLSKLMAVGKVKHLDA
jgi:hypothetical protein